jgi:hypothetical protein
MIGMHGRLISPQCIRTELNHTRGGDMDEMRVYDRMLDDSQIRKLAGGGGIGSLEPFERTLEDERWRQEWLHRYGWEDTQNPPPKLDAPVTAVRKAEIHDIYDIKQWVWKGSDGIRETTWPNVYNRSQLPGRSDYFIEPDWDCYSLSGKHVRFLMPDEKWNHLEVQGAAYGDFSYSDTRDEYGDTGDTPLFVRGQGHERTIHRLNTPYIGGTVHFENEFQEMPIGEFQVQWNWRTQCSRI